MNKINHWLPSKDSVGVKNRERETDGAECKNSRLEARN